MRSSFSVVQQVYSGAGVTAKASKKAMLIPLCGLSRWMDNGFACFKTPGERENGLDLVSFSSAVSKKLMTDILGSDGSKVRKTFADEGNQTNSRRNGTLSG